MLSSPSPGFGRSETESAGRRDPARPTTTRATAAPREARRGDISKLDVRVLAFRVGRETNRPTKRYTRT